MPSQRSIFLSLVLTLASAAAAAQQRTVEVVGIDTRDLERAAHHMGSSIEQVKQTRALLEKATDLALQSELDSSWPSLSRFCLLWRRAHPRKAAEAVDKLLDKLKTTAARTSDLSTYRWCESEAQSLMQGLEWDLERTEEFLKKWPERKDFEARDDAALPVLSQRLARQRILSTAERDPNAAAELLRSGAAGPSGDLLAEVAGRLADEGQSEAAQQLLAERIQALGEAPDSPENTLEFFQLLYALAPRRPGLIPLALRVYNSREWAPPTNMGRGAIRLESSRGSIQLNAQETALFFLLRSLNGSPQTLLDALELLPGLKAKLDRLGGFDQAAKADMVMSDQNGRVHKTGPFLIHDAMNRFQYWWGEAEKHPSEVRRRLVALVPSGLDWPLFLAVQSNCSFDPAFSRIGLDLLRERYFADEDSAFRHEWLPRLLDAHEHCEGIVDRRLIDSGFQLLDEDQERQAAQSETRRPRPDSDLEHRLLVEWSRLDFDAASDYVQQLEDAAEKFKVYAAMAEGRIGR